MARTLCKPVGLTVFPPHGAPDGDCMLARLLADEPWRRDEHWPIGFEGGLVHRLDTSTSGALLVADDTVELARLRTWFAERRLTKTYRFIAARDVSWDLNTCSAPIAHDRRRKGRMVVQRGSSTPHRGQWHSAQTTFERIANQLFHARMSTGVMHQIRVHAAFVGLPLLGDRRYGGGDTPADAPAGLTFYLHHEGLVGPEGFHTEPVPLPPWARS